MPRTDEETPLLSPSGSQPIKKTPLPWSQVLIVLSLQFCDIFHVLMISPFAPQLIREIGVTHGDEKKVGYYVGTMNSAYFVAQAFTTLYWSRNSDVIGRRPIIFIGLFALSSTMTSFGLSRTFQGLVLSRCLAGMLNGMNGAIKSIAAEITDATNIAQLYSYMPIAWSTIGLGPIIGGSLTHPVERFPSLFGNNQFLRDYPYFLPCAVATIIMLLVHLFTYLFFSETVKHPSSITVLLPFRKTQAYHRLSLVKSTSTPQTSTPTSLPVTPSPDPSEIPVPFRAILIPRVLIAAGNYASFALLDVAFRAIHPLFLSTPLSFGGLGLPPSTIGTILFFESAFKGLFQLLCFSRLHDRWGTKGAFLIAVWAAVPAFGLFPVISRFAKVYHDGGQRECFGSGGDESGCYGSLVWSLVAVQVGSSVVMNMAYSVFIFIARASPNKASLGATNGLSQMLVSITKAVGPALSSSLFSFSMQKGYLGGDLVYYIMLALTAMACMLGSLLPAHRDVSTGHR